MVSISYSNLFNNLGDNGDCPICCLEFEEKQQIKVMPVCGHIFHENCIEQWILRAGSHSVFCPVCKADIKDRLDFLDSKKAIEQQETQEMFRSLQNEHNQPVEPAHSGFNQIEHDIEMQQIEDQDQRILTSEGDDEDSSLVQA